MFDNPTNLPKNMQKISRTPRCSGRDRRRHTHRSPCTSRDRSTRGDFPREWRRWGRPSGISCSRYMLHRGAGRPSCPSWRLLLHLSLIHILRSNNRHTPDKMIKWEWFPERNIAGSRSVKDCLLYTSGMISEKLVGKSFVYSNFVRSREDFFQAAF